MKQRGIDILFAFGNEAEPYCQKYFSDFWPSFETAGVMLAQDGEPVLMVGPESEKFAREKENIRIIKRMDAFRESSSPGYAGLKLETFYDVIDRLLAGSPIHTVAIAGYNILPHFIYEELAEALRLFGEIRVVKDTIVDELREIKSENEINCIRKASEISAGTMAYLIENIRPGMTELQVKGMALRKMYESGAEGEAFPIWVLSGEGTCTPLGRARQKKIIENEVVHLQVGARYEGYASSVARPVVFGKAEDWLARAIRSGYEGFEALLSEIAPGKEAGCVADAFSDVMRKNGHYGWLMYGPCHGLGLAECEAPWIEQEADFVLKENMTFCIDLYMERQGVCGYRIEDSVLVTKEGVQNLTDFPRDIFVV
jgi:Xaa-Pro aminopeptidase